VNGYPFMNHDEDVARVLELIAAQPALFARQGAVVAMWQSYRGRRLGPYYAFNYRRAGRLISIYLGVESPAIEQIRQSLDKLQRAWRERRQMQRLRRQALASLRMDRLSIGRQLSPLGLHLQGWEFRGWRTSGLRSTRSR
jgi:hypothetical protein